MKPNTPPHCICCGAEMLYGTNWDKHVPICTESACPNFGLLQIGIEKMSEIKKEPKKKAK